MIHDAELFTVGPDEVVVTFRTDDDASVTTIVGEHEVTTDGGADVGLLRRFGVPLIELNQDATLYFDIHHSADDTFDKIDAENLKQVIAATAVVAYVAADMPGTFGRVPLKERKAPGW